MSTIKSFPLPDLGEGLTEADLLTWLVAVGDTIELNQNIAEVETAKVIWKSPPYPDYNWTIRGDVDAR